jgi:ATP-dependent Clp endopeptidase proteolytic subunit ClpP
MTKKLMISSDDPDDDISGEKQKFVSIINNNELYFYNDVNSDSVLMLNKTISDLSRHLLITQITFDLQETPHIKLHINSDGGEVFGALSVVDRINSSKVPVYSYAEGLVASASTLISVSCHKRFVRKNTILLIHQVRSWFQGTYEDFNDEKQNMDLIMKIIKDIYLKRTKFTESELNELLKRDIYLNAEDAIKYGLADEII